VLKCPWNWDPEAREEPDLEAFAASGNKRDSGRMSDPADPDGGRGGGGGGRKKKKRRKMSPEGRARDKHGRSPPRGNVYDPLAAMRSAVDRFIEDSRLDGRAARQLRSCNLEVQRAVILRGELRSARNSSAALIARIRQAEVDCSRGSYDRRFQYDMPMMDEARRLYEMGPGPCASYGSGCGNMGCGCGGGGGYWSDEVRLRLQGPARPSAAPGAPSSRSRPTAAPAQSGAPGLETADFEEVAHEGWGGPPDARPLEQPFWTPEAAVR